MFLKRPCSRVPFKCHVYAWRMLIQLLNSIYLERLQIVDHFWLQHPHHSMYYLHAWPKLVDCPLKFFKGNLLVIDAQGPFWVGSLKILLALHLKKVLHSLAFSKEVPLDSKAQICRSCKWTSNANPFKLKKAK